MLTAPPQTFVRNKSFTSPICQQKTMVLKLYVTYKCIFKFYNTSLMVLVIQQTKITVFFSDRPSLDFFHFEATLPISVTNPLVQAGVLGIYGLITAAPWEWTLVKRLKPCWWFERWNRVGDHHLLDMKSYEKNGIFCDIIPYKLVQGVFLHQEQGLSCDSWWTSCGLLSWKFGTHSWVHEMS